MAKKWATLNVNLEVKSELDSIKSSSQSYGGIIRELIKFWRDKKREYWTRRQEQRRQR